mmetsp:Transcript_1299/g.3998  ORF Transcript_1299/g.3998 Transcript_1299/m.3998 type:complete len:288 (+) Transcript_1299:1047-1910(+)
MSEHGGAAAFKEAAGYLGAVVLKRMEGLTGLQVMGAVGLTWAQYRMINSMLIDKFGIPNLASEVDVRREIKLDTATPIECGEATVEDRHGEERQCTFMRVLDLCDVVEKEVGALFQNDMINKEMDADGSPYAWKIVIKYMGDKGGHSFKFAVSVMNAKEPNSPKRCVVLCDFEGLDSHANLKKMVFDVFGGAMDAVMDMPMLILECDSKTVAKLVPSSCSLVAVGTTRTLPSPLAPATPPSTPTRTTVEAVVDTGCFKVLDGATLPAPSSSAIADVGEDGTWALIFE